MPGNQGRSIPSSLNGHGTPAIMSKNAISNNMSVGLYCNALAFLRAIVIKTIAINITLMCSTTQKRAMVFFITLAIPSILSIILNPAFSLVKY